VTDFGSEGGRPRITLENGVVLRPDKAVSAANAPLGVNLGFHSKQAPYRTMVLAGRTPKGATADSAAVGYGRPLHLCPHPARADHDR
jgi:hypothetical protein